MAIHKILIDDLLSSDYELIAIHSNLEDYRLAYLINKVLEIKLTKEQVYETSPFSFLKLTKGIVFGYFSSKVKYGNGPKYAISIFPFINFSSKVL